MGSKPVYVFGHRNPDADAICSAIGYADYKKAIGEVNVVAARCGNSNSRIDTILQHFDVPLPKFIGDVTPRVSDIMISDVHHVTADDTCAHALKRMDDRNVRTVPVLDKDRKVEGIVTIFQLGEFFIPKSDDPLSIRRVNTSISSVLDVLDARAVNLVEPEKSGEYFMRVGAMDIRSFGKFVSNPETPPDQSIVVVGDRWDIQQKAIQMGVRLLVITGNLETDPEVLEMAIERNVSVIVSPYDTASTSWLIRTATKIEPMIIRDIFKFGPDEKLSAVRRKLAAHPGISFMVVDEDDELLGVFSKTDLLKPVNTKVILVDHNELSQAVSGIEEVEITEIIDHHRLGNVPTDQPILFRNEPVGSTSTIVGDLFRKEGLEPSVSTAGVLMGGIISDTLHLKSPTSTSKDEEILKWLEGIAGVKAEELSDLIFSSGSLIVNTTPDKVVGTDCKIYDEGEFKYSMSQIEELGFDNFYEKTDVIAEALDAHRRSAGLDFAGLLVTDIRSQNSLFVVSGNSDVIDAINFPNAEQDDIFDMPGIVSRKKQLIPYFTQLLKELGVKV